MPPGPMLWWSRFPETPSQRAWRQLAVSAVRSPSMPPTKFGDRPVGYDAVAQQVKSIIGGPTSKTFNTNFASLYDQIDAESVRPGTLFASDPAAREITEQLIRDAGFDPIHLGDLGQAPLLEGLIALTQVLENGELGPFFYRFNRPGELSGK